MHGETSHYEKHQAAPIYGRYPISYIPATEMLLHLRLRYAKMHRRHLTHYTEGVSPLRRRLTKSTHILDMRRAQCFLVMVGANLRHILV